MALEQIPDDILNQAITEAPDGRPVQFICRQDNSRVLANKCEISAEISVRKLNKEITETKFYDKSYIDSLRHKTPFGTYGAGVFYTSAANQVLNGKAGGYSPARDRWPENIPENVGNRMVEFKKPEPKLF